MQIHRGGVLSHSVVQAAHAFSSGASWFSHCVLAKIADEASCLGTACCMSQGMATSSNHFAATVPPLRLLSVCDVCLGLERTAGNDSQ